MAIKQDRHIIKGMQKDLSISKFSPEFVFDAQNIRITSRDNDTLLSVTNEKGNTKIHLKEDLPQKINTLNIYYDGEYNLDMPVNTTLTVEVEHYSHPTNINIIEANTTFGLDMDFSPITDISYIKIIPSSFEDMHFLVKYHTDDNDIIVYDQDDISIKGTYLGSCVLNNYLVLFTTDTDTDYIYRINYKEGIWKCKILYDKDLNFSANNPIETLGIYENEEIQKVYWTDNRNQPRVINIIADNKQIEKWNTIENPFDFVRVIKSTDTYIDVTKTDTSNGSFHAGVIQYAFSYYNKYGQESNIVEVSPLNYITNVDRGAKPDDTVDTSFKIQITGPDTNFDFIRIYSILRTSIDSIPLVKRVMDIPTSNYASTIIDTGNIGESIDPTELLYKGGKDILAGTIAQKDNTMFLGNITLNEKLVPEEIINYFNLNKSKLAFGDPEVRFEDIDVVAIESTMPTRGEYITFLEYAGYILYYLDVGGTFTFMGTNYTIKNISHDGSTYIAVEVYSDPDYKLTNFRGPTVFTVESSRKLSNNNSGYLPKPLGFYPYKNSLNVNSRQLKHFKYLETYRLGVQLQYKTGSWSEPIWIDDKRNELPIEYKNDSYGTRYTYAIPTFDIDSKDIISNWYNAGYIGIRPVIVYPTVHDRECICQGIVCPTVYNTTERYHNSPFVQSSWFARPFAPDNYDGPSNNTNPSIGDIIEFRNNYPLHTNKFKSAEIQNMQYEVAPDVLVKDGNYDKFVVENTNNYFVDSSIFTMHSPEIEFDESIQNMDNKNIKFRIVGKAPITSFNSDININIQNNENGHFSFYKEPIGVNNISANGFKTLAASNSVAETINFGSGSINSPTIYPFHKKKLTTSIIAGTADIISKTISNLKYSYDTLYLKYDIDPSKNQIWNAYESNSNNSTGISGVEIYNPLGNSLVKLKKPEYSYLDGDLIYYGNVDYVSAATNNGYNEFEGLSTSGTNKLHDAYISIPVVKLKDEFNFDPIEIKYKTTTHAVMVLNYTKTGKLRVLPTIHRPSIGNINSLSKNFNSTTEKLFWDTNADSTKGIQQDAIVEYDNRNNKCGWLWIGELYNDSVVNRFGGNTKEALVNNTWLPCGVTEYFIDEETGQPRDFITVRWQEGDTYYQRYDNLRTYPSSLEDVNGIVDIVSFMCETHINIDGRYDRNRGLKSNLTVSPTNFNLLNPIYSQQNNFFNYKGIDRERFDINKFPNTITWTKEKHAGELIDTWTNITMANTLDLDGNKGEITSINTFNNELFCFQKKGLSNILFNSRVQINPSDGVPIEITNGYKVQGKRYISDSIGCTNKWSICESPLGIYFIDDEIGSLYLYNGKLNPLSDTLGMSEWFKSQSNLHTWNPSEFGNFITHYDKRNGDVYFTNKDHCLCFSEKLNQFTSFMSYESTPAMFNIEDSFCSIKNGSLWENFKGDYNMIYGTYKPYSIEFISNQDMPLDKVFNTLEFRADCLDGNNKLLSGHLPFDRLETNNEYQSGETDLKTIVNRPANLKQKFRIWRANIPRDNVNKMDRMRNPWLKIKLSKEQPSIDKVVLHDLSVSYFE